ncbi:hypothetical protein TNCV_97621 [Trichonephila clavipes]|nr:hypothetical protein TNCV_97621 [Trichonephila clavipes]
MWMTPELASPPPNFQIPATAGCLNLDILNVRWLALQGFIGEIRTLSQVSRDVELLLYGRSRDYYSAVGPSNPSRGGL